MATSTPISSGSDSAGKLLILEGQDTNVIYKPVASQSGTLQLSQPQRTTSKVTKIPILANIDDPDVHVEGTPKKVGGAEFDKVELNVKDLAIIIAVTNQILEDALNNPLDLITPEIATRFARKIDAGIVGKFLGTNLSSPIFDSKFNSDVTTSVNINDYDTGDSLRAAISDAMGEVEDNLYTPNGVLLSPSVRRNVRNAKRAADGAGDTDLVYNGLTDATWGLNTAYSANLNSITAADSANNVIGVVGDFTQLRIRVLDELTAMVSNEAAVTIDGDLTSLFENNMTAVRWEMRLGEVIQDTDAFCLIKKHA